MCHAIPTGPVTTTPRCPNGRAGIQRGARSARSCEPPIAHRGEHAIARLPDGLLFSYNELPASCAGIHRATARAHGFACVRQLEPSEAGEAAVGPFALLWMC